MLPKMQGTVLGTWPTHRENRICNRLLSFECRPPACNLTVAGQKQKRPATHKGRGPTERSEVVHSDWGVKRYSAGFGPPAPAFAALPVELPRSSSLLRSSTAGHAARHHVRDSVPLSPGRRRLPCRSTTTAGGELCGPASRVPLFIWIVLTASLALSPACGFGRWTHTQRKSWSRTLPMLWPISVGLAATPRSSTRLPSTPSTSANSVCLSTPSGVCCTTPAKPTWLTCRAH